MRFRKITITTSLVLLLLIASTLTAAAQGPYNYDQRTKTKVTGASPGYAHSIYIVRRGDTLLRIARRFGTSVQAILAVNPQIRNPNRIFAGQRLVIPVPTQLPTTYIIRRGDTLLQIARRFGTSVQAILAVNPQIRNPNRIFAGQPLTFSTISGAGPYQTPPDRQPDQPDVPQSQAQVIMQNISFQPRQIRVQPGTTVTWTNQDGAAHTVTAGTRDNPSGLFNSGNIGAGGSFSFTFEVPGTYNYFCSIHAGMDGVVVVEEGP